MTNLKKSIKEYKNKIIERIKKETNEKIENIKKDWLATSKTFEKAFEKHKNNAERLKLLKESFMQMKNNILYQIDKAKDDEYYKINQVKIGLWK